MITVTVYKDSRGYKGFQSKGHAGYAEEGYDIICAAVSALTVNAVNSVEQFTEDGFTVESEDGRLFFQLDEEASERTALLLDSMLLGLQEIQNTYGNEYIRLIFKEV